MTAEDAAAEVHAASVEGAETARASAEDVAAEPEAAPDAESAAVVEETLVSHGYVVDDVRGAPDRPGRELVFLASRPD